MSTFDDRERAFETKFAHDQEMQFKAVSRRNKRLGLWAAELLGRTGQDAEDYAMAVIRADFAKADGTAMLAKLVADLDGKADRAAILARMSDLLIEAKASLADG